MSSPDFVSVMSQGGGVRIGRSRDGSYFLRIWQLRQTRVGFRSQIESEIVLEMGPDEVEGMEGLVHGLLAMMPESRRQVTLGPLAGSGPVPDSTGPRHPGWRSRLAEPEGFGEWLDSMLRIKAMTRTDLAEAIGVNVTDVSRWLTPDPDLRALPGMMSLRKIARELDADLDWLVELVRKDRRQRES